MIIQYILNLDKGRKRYTGSGKFEIFGSYNIIEAIPYAANGIIELFGAAKAIVSGYNYKGFGQFELSGSSEINLPAKTVTLKFAVNDTGYDINNNQYLIQQIYDNAFQPLYKATKLNKEYIFNDKTLLTPPELSEYLNKKYNKNITNYSNKLNKIIEKLSHVTPFVSDAKTSIKFEIGDNFIDPNSKDRTVDSVLGSSDFILYQSENKVYTNNQALTPPESLSLKQKTQNKKITSFNNKLTQINQRLQEIIPEPLNYSDYAIKFSINQIGNNIINSDDRIISIYGINGQNFASTKSGVVSMNSMLTPPETAIYDLKNYNTRLELYNKKLSQINNKLNN